MPDRRAQAESARRARSYRPSDDDSESGIMQTSGQEESEGGEAGDEMEEERPMEAEEEDDEEEEEGSSESSTVQARSGITYDLAHLDADSEARALLGLTGRFDVVQCQTTQTGFDFQLSERPRVHIGSDTYTCTCPSYQGRPDVACQHIFVSSSSPEDRQSNRKISSRIRKKNANCLFLKVASRSTSRLFLAPTTFV